MSKIMSKILNLMMGKKTEIDVEHIMRFVSTDDGTKYVAISDMIELFRNSITQCNPMKDTTAINILDQYIKEFEKSEEV